jgi:hypothetical protein
MQHVCVRRDVTQTFEHGQRELGCRHLERKALANESSKLRLMVERIEAGHDTTRAVPQQEHRKAGMLRRRDSHQTSDIIDVVRELRNVAADEAEARVRRVDGEYREAKRTWRRPSD